MQISRRRVVQSGLASAGALLIGFRVLQPAVAGAAAQESTVLNAFVRIDGSGRATLIMPQVEMGQGVYTSLAMILAEELDLPWDRVGVEAAPADEALYANPTFGLQVTGNSNSIRAFWLPLRKAGARARVMLISAAASQWRTTPDQCRTEGGAVLHAATRRRLDYGVLAEAASRLQPPEDPLLKDEFRLIGRPLKRLDTPDKINGRARFGIDVMPPGVKFAALAACPVFGGRVRRVADTKARAIPGVQQVVVLQDLVAVVATNTWAARRGLAALEIDWDEGEHASVTSGVIDARLRQAIARPGLPARDSGDALAALGSGQRVEAEYELPFLAHAALEPMNCTVHVRADACEVWTGTQVQARACAAAAAAAGMPVERVILHNQLLGGAFGRRLEVDGIDKAVRIARQVEGPVKVIWSREEDMQHDFYRPAYRNRLAAAMVDGRIHAWSHRVAGSSIVARWLPTAFAGIDIDAVDGAVDIPYAIPNVRVEYVREEPPGVPTGFWRGVGPNNNVFAVESFLDEVAAVLKRDPVELRRELLSGSPRLRAVLEIAAARSGWGTPLPARTGRGVAVQTAFGSFIATVAEVAVDKAGEVQVRRIVCAVDTGTVVNPDTVIAQMEGGLAFGLTAALHGRITFERGRVQQSNFHDYQVLRIADMPAIEVHLVPSTEPPGGIGETGTTAAPAALCNALHAATGVRVRALPIDRRLLASEGGA